MPSNENSPDILKPDNRNCSIWRYMDLPKYLDLIINKRLFFCRADKIGDPFEGSTTYIDKLNKQKYYEKIKKIDSKKATENINKIIDDDIKLMKNFQKDTFLNCWHINDHESMAMWKIYGDASKSIAIKTTYEILHQCLPESVTTGKVEYIDYSKESIFKNKRFGAAPYFFKRIEFKSENELRCSIQRIRFGIQNPNLKYDPNEIGTYIPVDIKFLVNEVILSPTANDLLLELLFKITEKYEFQLNIHKSDLMKEPIF